jgi:hypothetical protein
MRIRTGKTTTLAALAAGLALAGALTACGSSSPAGTAAASAATAHIPTSFTDPNGFACDPAQAKSDGGLCPNDPAAPAASQSASPSAPPSPPASSQPAAAPTMTSQTDMVVFKVWGSGYPSVQYGSDSDTSNPQGGYGPLGNGFALPWSASMTYDPGAQYYAVSAQLQGSGDIQDSVTEVVTTHCSDGSRHTESFPLASGHASGGYAIAQAEYAGGDTGNAAQAESDAGC